MYEAEKDKPETKKSQRTAVVLQLHAQLPRPTLRHGIEKLPKTWRMVHVDRVTELMKDDRIDQVGGRKEYQEQ